MPWPPRLVILILYMYNSIQCMVDTLCTCTCVLYMYKKYKYMTCTCTCTSTCMCTCSCTIIYSCISCTLSVLMLVCYTPCIYMIFHVHVHVCIGGYKDEKYHSFSPARSEAVKLGLELQRRHFIHHVTFDHVFKDEWLFYRLLGDGYARALNAKLSYACVPRPG